MDVVHGEHIVYRATILQQKSGQPVRFELTDKRAFWFEPGSTRRNCHRVITNNLLNIKYILSISVEICQATSHPLFCAGLAE